MPPSPQSSSEKQRRDFRLNNDAIVSLAETERVDFRPGEVELPRFYGAPLLFAIARDARTIFAYWSVDWPSVFANATPVDRQVHLRVCASEGAEETTAAADPMAGNCYIGVSTAGATYRVELGYYAPRDTWHSVAASEDVTMPPDAIAESADVDLATIPLHLSFERLIDLFRTNRRDALARIIGQFEQRAVSAADVAQLAPEERELLRALDLSLEQLQTGRDEFGSARTAAALRRRAEAILGIGASSSPGAFGSSSWS